MADFRHMHRFFRLAGLCILLLILAGNVASSNAGQKTEIAAPFGNEGMHLLGWAPDGAALLASRAGQTIVISDTHAQQLSELWILPLDGRPATRITDNGVLPRFSNDGRTLSYYACDDQGKWAEMVHDLEAGAATQSQSMDWSTVQHSMDDATASVTGLLHFPSPDGRHIATLQLADGPSATLIIEDMESGKSRPHFAGESDFYSPISWSPDGESILFSRTAPGTRNAGQIYWLDLVSGNITAITAGQRPIWSPDSRHIAYQRDGQIWLLQVDASMPRKVEADEYASPILSKDAVDEGDGAVIAAQLVPPATIRVKHSEDNYYRTGIPVGQIDIIPFEEYVKRVVPYEVVSSWPAEILKAQAIAARTYAWWFVIRHTELDFDVNDWTDYQVMGNTTFPQTDAAVDATAGQHITHEGDIILAEFSHQNGSPTAGRTGFPYMQSIDDPVGFGETVHGHGRGFSQEGGRRWADWYDWNYEQMLAHYYTGITIERPANVTAPPQAPAGAIVHPRHGLYVSSNQIDIRANASDADGDLAGVEFYASWADTPGHTQSQHLGAATESDDGWHLLWDISAIPDQPLESNTVVITGTASDAGGRTTDLVSAIIGIDRQLPTGIVQTPSLVSNPAVPITVTAGAAGSSDMAGILLSNNWIWEEDEFYYFKNSGAIESDATALDGQAWVGRAGNEEIIYGPYTQEIPAGRPYRAIFRLKTDTVTDTGEIATLDVADSAGAELLGIRRLHGNDFRQANVYQEFGVDFWHRDAGASGLEFRIAYHGPGTLHFDRVLIAVYPISLPTQPTTTIWEIPDTQGTHTVQAKFADNAGNLSADYMLSITLGEATPAPTATPTVTDSPTPTSSAEPTITRTATATATASATMTNTPTPTTTTVMPTATPTRTGSGQAYITLDLGSVFADLNGNEHQDAGEGNLADVEMAFQNVAGTNIVPPVVGESWHFTTGVVPRQSYRFIANKAGFQQRVETIIAPDAGLEVTLNWPALGMRPQSGQATLPLILQGAR